MTKERIIEIRHCIYCPERRKTEDGITCTNVWYYYNLPPYLSDEHRKKSQKRPLYEVFDKNTYGIPDECPLMTKEMYIQLLDLDDNI